MPQIRTEERPSRKFGLITSQGGHLQQMLTLAPLYENTDSFLVTTKVTTRKQVNHGLSRQYTVPDINEGRGKSNPLLLIASIISAWKILRKERPDIIISTGAGVSVPFFFIAKIKKIPSIYVESFARIKSLSSAGKVCYHLASTLFVQHEGLCRDYPNAVYCGSVYGNI